MNLDFKYDPTKQELSIFIDDHFPLVCPICKRILPMERAWFSPKHKQYRLQGCYSFWEGFHQFWVNGDGETMSCYED